MYTIYAALNNHVRTVVLSIVLISCGIGQAWAQPGGYEDRVVTSESSPVLGVSGITLDQAATRIVQQREAEFVSIYPMPFNPETTIRFAVTATQPVRLTIYDVLGRPVQVLVEGRLEAGEHEARFEAHNLPSGLYFARLQTATGVVTRSLVLAK